MSDTSGFEHKQVIFRCVLRGVCFLVKTREKAKNSESWNTLRLLRFFRHHKSEPATPPDFEKQKVIPMEHGKAPALFGQKKGHIQEADLLGFCQKKHSGVRGVIDCKTNGLKTLEGSSNAKKAFPPSMGIKKKASPPSMGSTISRFATPLVRECPQELDAMLAMGQI